MHGCVLEQQVKATCFSSAAAPTMLDYWIVHEDLQNIMIGIGADWKAPIRNPPLPHSQHVGCTGSSSCEATASAIRHPKAGGRKQRVDLAAKQVGSARIACSKCREQYCAGNQ